MTDNDGGPGADVGQYVILGLLTWAFFLVGLGLGRALMGLPAPARFGLVAWIGSAVGVVLALSALVAAIGGDRASGSAESRGRFYRRAGLVILVSMIIVAAMIMAVVV